MATASGNPCYDLNHLIRITERFYRYQFLRKSNSMNTDLKFFKKPIIILAF